MQPEMLEFLPINITAKSIDGLGQSKPLKVFTYEQLVAEEKSRQTVAMIGAVLGGVGRGMNAANAGYTNTNGSFNASNNYGGTAQGTFNATSYNSFQAYSAQQLASAQTSAEFANLRSQGADNLAAMQDSIIKEHTLGSGEWYGGKIVLDVPKKDKVGSAAYVIELNFGGELYSFKVRQAKSLN